MNKRFLLGISAFIVLVITGVFYFFLTKEADPLPESSVLAEKIGASDVNLTVEEILERHLIDKEHAYIPFKTEEGEYGVSLWVFDNDWKAALIDEGGDPKIWRVDPSDPSTYYLVWNIHPDDDIEILDIYHKRERSYRITAGEHTYIPALQSKLEITVSGQSYGARSIPDVWTRILEQENKLQMKQTGMHSATPSESYLQTRYLAYDHSGEPAKMEKTLNGDGYSTGLRVDIIPRIEKENLE